MGGGFCGAGFGTVGATGGSRCRSLHDRDVGGVHLRAVRRRRSVRRAAQHFLARVPRHRPHLRHPQTVLAERSGLVEADHVDTAERLHRARDADQRTEVT